MLFNSLHFLVFFCIVTLLFFRLKDQKSRMILLLVASCYFYMSLIPKYILIMGGVIVVDYFAGRQIEKSQGHTRKTWLVLSLVANIGTLALFKYYNFFLDNIAALHIFNNATQLPFLKMALPIGLSFHTFQAMSYTIEVYRGKQAAEKDFILYSVYVLFYPQMVAGPIERPQNILPQLAEYRPYNFDNVKEGLSRMMWGFFKKVVIADRLALMVDHAHTHVGNSSWTVYATGAVMYSFQIYCDFSGYSDIALGAAKVMNIDLMQNFNQPYIARNISNFWSRWHISLSTWFRDYVYIPLGGNRKGEPRRIMNVLIIFILSGLWHGANWTFVIWGLLHGLLVVLFPGKVSNKKNNAQGNSKAAAIAWAVVNFILVTILWIFFRSPNVYAAADYIRKIVTLVPGNTYTGISATEVGVSVLLIGIMMAREWYLPGFKINSNRRFYCYIAIMTVCCYYLGVFTENQFIYFQF